MTTINIRRRISAQAARYAMFCLFAILAMLSLSRQTHAQWTTPDAQGNTSTTGNVGIGTTTPRYPLTVRSNSITAPLNLIGGTGNIEIWKDAAGSVPSKAIAFGLAIPGNAAGDDIQLSTYNGAAWSSRLTISNSTGNVGIGTAAPTAKLHVTGDIRVDGNIAAKYQDVAEWVPSTETLRRDGRHSRSGEVESGARLCQLL